MGTHNIILNEREKKNKLSMSEYAKIQTMILKISPKQHNTDHMYINLLQGVPFKKIHYNWVLRKKLGHPI